MPTTLNPARASEPATSSPPGPIPITTASTFSVITFVSSGYQTMLWSIRTHRIVKCQKREYRDARHGPAPDLVTPLGSKAQ